MQAVCDPLRKVFFNENYGSAHLPFKSLPLLCNHVSGLEHCREISMMTRKELHGHLIEIVMDL